jgi:protein tyrosine phosphatase (PTP) superfamily phosphohydrolase (DUF442 family)
MVLIDSVVKNSLTIFAGAALALAMATVSSAQQSSPAANPFEQLGRKADPPVVLCIDDKPGAGGQPSHQAYIKAAQSGYRSVLTLRTTKDGVDLTRERLMVEQSGLHYFNLSIAAQMPRREQVDEFLKLTRDPANHPMLVNCAFAGRIAPLMMMFRIVEQGWTEERAVEEARLSGGHKAAELKSFARNYLAERRKGTGR